MTATVGPIDRRCTAKAKTTGERCRRRPVPGGTVCVIHGGAAPQVRAAAGRRLLRERLDGDLGRLLGELEIDAAQRHPIELLLDVVHRCSAMVQVLAVMVGGLRTDGPPAVEPGEVDDAGRLWGRDHLGDGAPHVLAEMYGQWLERAARASKLALDAGIAEREIRVTEEQGRQLAAVLRGVLGDLGHQLDAPNVRTVVQRHLQAVQGGR